MGSAMAIKAATVALGAAILAAVITGGRATTSTPACPTGFTDSGDNTMTCTNGNGDLTTVIYRTCKCTAKDSNNNPTCVQGNHTGVMFHSEFLAARDSGVNNQGAYTTTAEKMNDCYVNKYVPDRTSEADNYANTFNSNALTARTVTLLSAGQGSAPECSASAHSRGAAWMNCKHLPGEQPLSWSNKHWQCSAQTATKSWDSCSLFAHAQPLLGSTEGTHACVADSTKCDSWSIPEGHAIADVHESQWKKDLETASEAAFQTKVNTACPNEKTIKVKVINSKSKTSSLNLKEYGSSATFEDGDVYFQAELGCCGFYKSVARLTKLTSTTLPSHKKLVAGFAGTKEITVATNCPTFMEYDTLFRRQLGIKRFAIAK